jgi:hypothetical protein
MQSIDFFMAAENYFVKMVDNLQNQATKENQLNILESNLLKESRELARLLLQGHIDSRGCGEIGEAVISAQEIKLTHKRERARTLDTVFGKVCINQVGYSKRGYQSLFPLDASLNLPKGSFSHGLQQMIVQEIVKGSFQESLLTIERQTGFKIGKRQSLEIVNQCAMDFDAFYQEQFLTAPFETRSNTPIMVLTTDAKGIVMRPEGLRLGTQKRQEKGTKKLKHRLSKGEKLYRKRMAQVASIYFIDRFVRRPENISDDFLRKKAMLKRPRPLGKRIWASVKKESSIVISE